ncbi:MAG: phosphatidylserine decarboxylase [Bacteroidales bacterium]|nr:phosphatidylserine decarboxylase [Bacteroidales bacterium]
MKKNKQQLIIIILLVVVLFFSPWKTPPPLHYIDRSTGQIKTEQTMSGTWLYWLYNNPLGELTLSALVKRKIITEIYGTYMHSSWSAHKIDPFIRQYHIDTSQFVMNHFGSFNAFFIRKLKPGVRKIDTDKQVVIAPADSKCLVYPDIDSTDFLVKGMQFNVQSFLRNDTLAKKYRNGSLLVFRLAPTDYHRYHFPLSGIVSPTHKISGFYYSVNPIALREDSRIFLENKRQYQIIQSPVFGKVVMAEIGATMVGSMVSTHLGNTAVKGEEEGYFQFGGSTVVLLFEKGKIHIDGDLIKNSKNHLETSVRMGEEVGLVR